MRKDVLGIVCELGKGEGGGQSWGRCVNWGCNEADVGLVGVAEGQLEMGLGCVRQDVIGELAIRAASAGHRESHDARQRQRS